jgi:hypothetical protein
MGALAFVVIIVASIYIGDRLETIEDRLRYSAPTAAQEGEVAVALEDAAQKQAVYVPVYSHVYSNGGQPYLVETTLSIRNTDTSEPVVLSSVRYFDTKGVLVKDYLHQPLALAPLESTEFLVEKQDISGGSGANFVVEWAADTVVNEPIIEAVMIGFKGSNSISLIRAGTPIDEK